MDEVKDVIIHKQHPHLIVLIKKPGTTFNADDVVQLEKYILALEKHNDNNFLVFCIADKITEYVTYRANKYGNIKDTYKSRIFVKTWDNFITQIIMEHQNYEEKVEEDIKNKQCYKDIKMYFNYKA